MESIDMVGLDVALASASQFYRLLYSSTEPPPILQELVQKGELGAKSGRGFLDYTGKSTEEILDSWNRRLLKQLVLFKEMDTNLQDSGAL
jgi:3-hydroxyacyl-CoA dehydrogenase